MSTVQRSEPDDGRIPLHFLRQSWQNTLPIDALGSPHDDYSRLCWLPVLGPAAWLLWGTVARHIDGHRPVHLEASALTDALGLGRTHRLDKILNRLDKFDIADKRTDGDDDQWWELWTTTPPLPLRHHRTVGPLIREFHYRSLEALTSQEDHDLETIFGSNVSRRQYGHSNLEGTTP